MREVEMKTLKNLESKQHGTPDFPYGYYRVDKNHPSFHMPFHWHTEFEILLVRSGRFSLTLNNETKELFAGDMAFIGGGVLHGGHPTSDDCVYDCAVFNLNLLNRGVSIPVVEDILKDRASVVPFLSVIDSHAIWELVHQLMDTDLQEDGSARSLTRLGLLCTIFGTLIRDGLVKIGNCETAEDIARWKKLLYYIEEHYSEKITLEMLADAAGLSPKYLCRAFARLTGKTPLAYLNDYRLECACEMLRNTEETILSVAISCGFNDQSYFVKQFRKSKGITPGAYRKQ